MTDGYGTLLQMTGYSRACVIRCWKPESGKEQSIRIERIFSCEFFQVSQEGGHNSIIRVLLLQIAANKCWIERRWPMALIIMSVIFRSSVSDVFIHERSQKNLFRFWKSAGTRLFNQPRNIWNRFSELFSLQVHIWTCCIAVSWVYSVFASIRFCILKNIYSRSLRPQVCFMYFHLWTWCEGIAHPSAPDFGMIDLCTWHSFNGLSVFLLYSAVSIFSTLSHARKIRKSCKLFSYFLRWSSLSVTVYWAELYYRRLWGALGAW